MKRFEFIFPMYLAVKYLVILGLAILLICLRYKTNILFYVSIGLLMLILFVIDYNLFYLYRITESGIENKHLKFQWHEIDKVEVVYTEHSGRYRYVKTVFPPVVCIGAYNTSLFKLDRHKCVFFPITQRNLELIEKYSKGENEALNDLISLYKHFPDERVKIVFFED